jgi:hypothetical protein
LRKTCQAGSSVTLSELIRQHADLRVDRKINPDLKIGHLLVKHRGVCATIREPFRLFQREGVDDSFIKPFYRSGQWRTMASRASRSAGISRFDGLLAPAAELCRIVRASYLSPSFPFFLCFELWRYLDSTRRGRRPRRKETRGPAGSPSFLRLLRGAALAVTLMLPAEGWAQVALPAAPAPPQGNAVAQQDGTRLAMARSFPERPSRQV